MPLSSIPQEIRDALLVPEEPALAHVFGPSAPRFAVHRRHFVHSLTQTLENTFPAVVNLVDRRFFAYAADAFIRAHPPAAPCLFEYGAALAAFLDSFPPCESLPYLGDVARLEWAMHCAFHAPDDIAPDAVFLPSVFFVSSRWPVYAIWRVATGRDEGPVDPAAGPAHVLVYRGEDAAYAEPLDAAEFVLHTTLAASGGPVNAAAALRAHDGTAAAAAARRRLESQPHLLAHPLTEWRSS
jgi:hypothetical protein